MNFAAMMLIALALDLLIGWPNWLYARIGHPVTWLGALISGLEHRWNHGARRAKGVLLLLVVTGLATSLGAALQVVLPDGWAGVVLGGILAWPLVALRAMHDHVADVARPLAAGDLDAGRRAVAMIVGRDVTQLDEAGVARAALESLAENTSDGIVAPIFWGALLGLPGIAAYKAINTLDSMIGHRSERYRDFGWASARVDDLVNLIPARLTGLIFALVGARRAAWACMWRDAPQHRSPNAGWPESAMAGALDVRLSGPRAYGSGITPEPWVNAAARDPGAADVQRGLQVYARAMVLLAMGIAVALWP